jgi:hypothetical protein
LRDAISILKIRRDITLTEEGLVSFPYGQFNSRPHPPPPPIFV